MHAFACNVAAGLYTKHHSLTTDHTRCILSDSIRCRCLSCFACRRFEMMRKMEMKMMMIQTLAPIAQLTITPTSSLLLISSRHMRSDNRISKRPSLQYCTASCFFFVCPSARICNGKREAIGSLHSVEMFQWHS